MRIIAAFGVVILIIGLGLAARFLIMDDGVSPTPSGVQTTSNGDGSTPLQPGTAQMSVPEFPQPTTEPSTPQAQSSDDPALAPVETLPEIPGLPSDSTQTPFALGLPLDCSFGDDCYIVSYVNAGTEQEPRDYSCGSLSYDEHRGTDFRIIDTEQMEAGVNVIAAAPGTVLQTREGMPDANFKLFGRAAVQSRGRGNFVAIDHGNGYITTYAHLKRGSVTVRPGDQVVQGQILGTVGMSGLTEFPHVHFEVSRDGTFIDPFTGRGRHEGCGLDGTPLWQIDVEAQLRYPRTLVIHSGFANQVLNRAAVEYSLFTPSPISTDASALVMHVYLAGIQPGDGFVAEITDPNGQRFVRSGRHFDQFSMVRLLAIGKQDLTEPLVPGLYTGIFQYFRKDANNDDLEIFSLTETVTVR